MKNKKSFVLYCDILHTIEHLNNEQAGLLFKHVLRYVNDQEPILTDPILSIAFEPIKQSLKRDLDKWQSIRNKRVEAGRKGGKQKQTNLANASKSKQNLTNLAVSVSVSDSVNVNEILKYFNSVFNKRARIVPKDAIDLYNKLGEQGYDTQDIKNAMKGAFNEKWHKERNYDVCTLFYFTKAEVIDRYCNLSNKNNKYIPTK